MVIDGGGDLVSTEMYLRGIYGCVSSQGAEKVKRLEKSLLLACEIAGLCYCK